MFVLGAEGTTLGAFESKARARENMYNIVERALSNLVAALFSAYTILTQGAS